MTGQHMALVGGVLTPWLRCCGRPLSDGHREGCRMVVGERSLLYESDGHPEDKRASDCPNCAGKYHVCSCEREAREQRDPPRFAGMVAALPPGYKLETQSTESSYLRLVRACVSALNPTQTLDEFRGLDYLASTTRPPHGSGGGCERGS